MNIRIGKPALTVILLACLTVAAYWYWSPFLAMRAMRSAAQAHDADAFNTHVDYPRVRDSLKTQLSAKMNHASDGSNPLAALGAMMGRVVADRLVDTMVQPALVMRAMQSGQFGPPAPAAPDAGTAHGDGPKWTWIRVGADKLVAYPDDGSGGSMDRKMQIVFERSGFASWKVTDLRLPATRP